MAGCIDVHGYLEAIGSWLLCGWVPPVADGVVEGMRRLTLRFERGVLGGEALVVDTVRADLGSQGRGIAVRLPTSDPSLGRLLSAGIEFGGTTGEVALLPTPGTAHLEGEALVEALKAQRLDAGRLAGDFRALLDRPGFEGRDTIDTLEGQVAVRIDEAIACGERDMLLDGWLIAASPGIRSLRLRSGRRSTRLDLRSGLVVPRPDVVAKYGQALRSRDSGCGFVLFVRDAVQPGAVSYLEIETASGEFAFLRLSPSGLSGLAAIRSILSRLSPRYDEVPRTFDLIGPALAELNRARLSLPPRTREMGFGVPPADPLCSIVVPLHGRIDYMEVQVALMADAGLAARHELIYVVDDPDAGEAACRLADSLFRRFRMPLRLILLEENLGFAPASNVGLTASRGHHVCFLNSDVFAVGTQWLDRLLDRLQAEPAIGILGPLLLFEDGTVQHQGMGYEALPEFGHWLFPTHPGKGSRPSGGGGAVARVPAITGACMVMRRTLAVALGGFDEAFVIGDFEDSDLCLRARARGVACAVDRSVALHHLERKSQVSGAEAWRLNVTLYNAWLHQGRWADAMPNIETSRVPLRHAPPLDAA